MKYPFGFALDWLKGQQQKLAFAPTPELLQSPAGALEVAGFRELALLVQDYQAQIARLTEERRALLRFGSALAAAIREASDPQEPQAQQPPPVSAERTVGQPPAEAPWERQMRIAAAQAEQNLSPEEEWKLYQEIRHRWPT